MEKILKNWLFQQCQMVPGASQGLLLTGPPNKGPYTNTLSWPDKTHDRTVLARVAKAALRNKKPVIITRNSTVAKTGEPLDALACPLFVKGRLLGVIAIEMTSRSQPMQQATVQRVQMGVQWLESMLLLSDSTTKAQLVNLIDLVAAALDHEQFHVAVTEVANELASRFACRLVSIGFRRYNRVRVEAVSQSAKIDQQSNLVRAICDAMDESLDQGATITFPRPPDTPVQVTRCHTKLAMIQEGAAICTIPLIRNGKAVGAILLERKNKKPFTQATIRRCEQIGMLLGPVLETRRRDERPVPLKMIEFMRSGIRRLIGPRRLALKLTIGLATIAVIWLSLVPATFRITSDSVLEAGVRRAVVAPQMGYIDAAHVRAGDLVHEGDLLASLDDQELRLEQRKWQSQLGQLLKEYRKALSAFDRSEVAILNAKRAQAEAQLNLIKHQLARTKLFAPISGLIVKGDLSQALGSPVKTGDVLYEVSPTDEYRVVLKVDDRDIGLVATGQCGHLRLSGIPHQTIAITIDRLTPVSTTEEGRNYFRVEAVMDQHSDLMRSGMEGIAKIEIGKKKLIWIWTRRLVEWTRLFAWNRLP